MPYESKSQHRLFRAKEAEGELPKGTASKWAHETKDIKRLPEHKRKKGRHAKKRKMGRGGGR